MCVSIKIQIWLITIKATTISSSNYKSFINDNSPIQLGIFKTALKCLRPNHPQQIITGHLHINFIRNKYDIIKPMLMHGINIFMVT